MPLTLDEVTGSTERTSIYADTWILGALIAALVLRLINLSSAALWLDETFTATWVRMSWMDMFRAVLSDNHLPLYPALMKAWAAVVGTSPWVLRLPSVALSCAMVPLVAAAALPLAGRSAARWAAYLTALFPYLIQHAQEARMYALFGALSAVAFLQLARFLTHPSRRLGIGFVVCNLALLSTHYYGVFLLAAEGLILLALRYSRWRDWALAFAATCGAVIVLVLSAKLLATPHAGSHYQIGWVALPGLIWSMIGGYALLPDSAELHTHGVEAAARYLPLALAVAGALVVIGASAFRALSRQALLLCAVIIAVPVLFPFVVSQLFDVGINPRYAMPATPALLVLLAAGINRGVEGVPGKLSAIVLILCLIVGMSVHLYDPGHGREDVHGATRWLEQNVPLEEEILVTSEEMAILTRFHWPQRKLTLYPAKRIVASRNNVDQLADGLPGVDRARVIYIFGRDWLSDPDGSLRAALKARYGVCEGAQLRGIQIMCLRGRG
jgi:mannosyltransferase